MGTLVPTSADLQTALESVMDFVLSTDCVTIESYVDKLRSQNPGITSKKKKKKILSRKSMKNGLVGAVTGLGGMITLPVTIPTDLICSWRIQASMAFSIAYAYGHTKDTTDLRTDLYLILAGDSSKEVLKRLGIETTKGVTKKLVDKYITREVMVKIWKYIPQKIITKAGETSATSFMKMVPLVGAPVGFVFDWGATQAVGRVAMSYYRG